MHGESKKSNKTRYIIFISHMVIIVFIWWLYFGGEIEFISLILPVSFEEADFIRSIILFSFSLIYFVRMSFTLFSLLKRRIEAKEMGVIIFGIAFYQIGFAISAIMYNAPLDFFDIIPFALFVLGSYINTKSEYQRKKFKEKEQNKGELYTGGLFKYAQHINYFGEFLWILGFALMTRNLWALIMPLYCFLGFVLFNIPMLDKHLEQKYQEQFIAWKKRTKKFIPYIY